MLGPVEEDGHLGPRDRFVRAVAGVCRWIASKGYSCRRQPVDRRLIYRVVVVVEQIGAVALGETEALSPGKQPSGPW